MKKILFFAAATAVALSSCSKTDVAAPQEAIGFGTYYSNTVSTATKATENFADDAKFGVSAYFTESADFATTAIEKTASFMTNQEVTFDGTDWSYTPPKYWPNDTDDKVSFFAVSDNTDTVPATLGVTSDMPSFTLTPGTALTDILVASAVNQTKEYGSVDFVFQHALAGIKMDALVYTDADDTTVDDATTVTINELSIDYGTADITGGTFKYSATGTPVGTWSQATTTSNIVSYKGASDAGYVLDNDGVATDIVEAFIVPNDANYATVTVTYTVFTDDPDGTTNDSSVVNTATFVIKPSTINTLYTYNIKISLTGVVVTGTINTDWTAATNSPFEVTVENSTSQTIE